MFSLLLRSLSNEKSWPSVTVKKHLKTVALMVLKQNVCVLSCRASLKLWSAQLLSICLKSQCDPLEKMV